MDTLKTFGRGEKFLGKSESISDNIERPNYILNATKANTEGIVGFVNVTLQVVSMLLIVLLVMQGKVMLGVLASGTNLIGGVCKWTVWNFKYSSFFDCGKTVF